MALVHIAPNKQTLTNLKGDPFFIAGVNYNGAVDRVWQMWEATRFDPTLIKHDFAKIAQLDLNVVRIFIEAPLMTEMQTGDFNKLDRVIQLAAEQKLLVLLTFTPIYTPHLAPQIEQINKIAEYYQYDPAILGWDLGQHLSFRTMAAAIYPPSTQVPLQSNALTDHYGVRVSTTQATQQQRVGHIPHHLNPKQAFWFANGLAYWLEYEQAAHDWAAQHQASMVDYASSSAAASWQPLLTACDQTLAAWLQLHYQAVRKADEEHLITLGHQHWLWASLAANQALDFQMICHTLTPSLESFQQLTGDLAALKKNFPDQPLLVGEFGFANQTATNPATSQPIESDISALFETALLAHLKANGYAGGLKWCLNDSLHLDNPYQASFGLYQADDEPKPICTWLTALKPAAQTPLAQFYSVCDRLGLAFRFDDGTQVMLAGGIFQDETVSWQADKVACCLIIRQDGWLEVYASGSGTLHLLPWKYHQNWQRNAQSTVSLVTKESKFPLMTFPAGQSVSWQLTGGQTYRMAMGEAIAPPSPEVATIQPNPGEHVILLPNSDKALHLAYPYICHFSPEISFAPEQVLGRWAYVTVLANLTEIPDTFLAEIRATGAVLVERLDGDVKALVARLIKDNTPFLEQKLFLPPLDSPLEAITRPGERQQTSSWTVTVGDSLSKIALAAYGQSNLESLIFEANRDILTHPRDLRPGMILHIPPLN